MKPFLSIALALALGGAALQADAAVISSGLDAGSYTQSGSWAGHNAQSAFNGGGWNSGNWGTQWIQVDLGSTQAISGLHFRLDQLPAGVTWHQIFVSDTAIGGSWSALSAVASRSGWSNNGELENFSFSATGRYVEIVANGGPSWTALGEVQVFGPDATVPEPATYLLSLLGLGLAGLAAKRRKA
ncbi:MAG TPA: discoidin domain-containing protein [Burkholderiaceae bacterium]|nr:discoidin domain-containing protein [Burkholderiaceae bacterium]